MYAIRGRIFLIENHTPCSDELCGAGGFDLRFNIQVWWNLSTLKILFITTGNHNFRMMGPSGLSLSISKSSNSYQPEIKPCSLRKYAVYFLTWAIYGAVL
jgi:hypothetical protein